MTHAADEYMVVFLGLDGYKKSSFEDWILIVERRTKGLEIWKMTKNE